MNFSIPVVALLGGVAIGYCCASRQPAASETRPDGAPARERARGRIAAAGDAESVKALRARVRELESALAAARSAEEAPAEQKVEETPRREGRDGPDWRGMRERMERWRRENPEEFARMEERRKAFMQQRAQRAQSKLEFLASVDTSRMSKKARETHVELQTLIAKREEMETKMFSPDLSDEDREDLFREMRETDHAIRERNSQARENLLRQTAETLGYTGDAATEIVDTIGEIYEATSSNRGGPGGPGGPGRGPGGMGRR